MSEFGYYCHACRATHNHGDSCPAAKPSPELDVPQFLRGPVTREQVAQAYDANAEPFRDRMRVINHIRERLAGNKQQSPAIALSRDSWQLVLKALEQYSHPVGPPWCCAEGERQNVKICARCRDHFGSIPS